MPAWASEPKTAKGALRGAFFMVLAGPALAGPALADPDLSGLWQNIDRTEPFCQDYINTFDLRDGILFMTPFALGFGWPMGRTRDWVDGRLDLEPIGEGLAPLWVQEVEGGLDICKTLDGKEECTRFRRCPLAPTS